MKTHDRFTTRWSAALVAAGVVAGLGGPALADEAAGPGQSATTAPAADAASAVPGAGGLMVYIDPKTGNILSAPAPGALPLVLSDDILTAVSTSGEGLVSVPSSVPGGGVGLSLQGRFQNPMAAMIDANGALIARHLGEEPAQ